MKKQPMPQQAKKTLVLSIYFALAFSALLVFWQVRNFDFVHCDDNDYVSKNPNVLNGLTPAAVSWAFTTDVSSHWHPLTWLSLMLDCQLFGPNPAGFHLVNLLLHIVNTLLLFAVLKRMTGALWQSAFVAALFALHPMHVESVAWISERKDVLSTFFWLLTMLAYTQYVKKPGIVQYLLTLLFFALGLMAKPMLVTLPFVLLLLDYWPFQRKISWHLLVEKIPLFALVAVSSVVTFLVMRTGGALIKMDTLPLNSRIANAVLSYVKYLYKMVWPRNLAIFYPFGESASFPFWQVAMCVLLLLVISIFVIRLGRNQKYLPVGWFWFIGTLVPVIGIIQVGQQAYADRYTYVPYIGLFIMIAWGLPVLLSKLPQRKIALGLSMVIVLTTLGICDHQQTSYWKNSVTLFSHALEVTQKNWLAHNDLGLAYDDLGRSAEAIENFSQAIKIIPDYAEAHTNLGIVYTKLGRWQDAIDEHKQAIKFKPDLALAHNNLGIVYTKLGRWQDAIDAYKQAIRIKPDFVEVYNNLGYAYAALGRYAEAIDTYNQAIRIKPDFVDVHYNLGNAYYALGRYPEAINVFGQVIKIKPDYAEAHYNLGMTYSALGRWPQAIDAYKQTIKLKPDLAVAHANLGVAYLVIGDKNSAMAEYNILKSLNSELANNLLNQINK
jgi:tetratricopeptide (TPR) repeat protein